MMSPTYKIVFCLSTEPVKIVENGVGVLCFVGGWICCGRTACVSPCGGHYREFDGVLIEAAKTEVPVTKLMIFGGTDHKQYLGCLNCSKYGTESILNEYGDDGSTYAPGSIWNPYGVFGKRLPPNTCLDQQTQPVTK